MVRASTIDDTEAWRSLARTVEHLFGAAMADADGWNESLVRHIERGTAWCAVGEHYGVLGGVWCSMPEPEGVHIRWLAVLPEARRRGAGRALVEHAIERAGERHVLVVTFGEGHPGRDEAEAARNLYRSLGFVLADAHIDSPDGTPRELLVRRAGRSGRVDPGAGLA
jgi:ribosomal protein S18 acetylase RimI-like enzyme